MDLFVLGNKSQPGSMVYGVMRYIRKGTRLSMPYDEDAYIGEERLMDAVHTVEERTAPEDGYYFLDREDEEKFVWLLSCVDPADSLYAVIGASK